MTFKATSASEFSGTLETITVACTQSRAPYKRLKTPKGANRTYRDRRLQREWRSKWKDMDFSQSPDLKKR